MNAPQGIELARSSQRVLFHPLDREMQAEIDGARRGPGDDLSGLGPEGLRATGYQRDTSLEMRQVFMAGPPRVGRGAHLLTAGPLA